MKYQAQRDSAHAGVWKTAGMHLADPHPHHQEVQGSDYGSNYRTESFDEENPETAVDASQALPFFLGPLLALPFSYIGVYIGSRLVGQPAFEQAESRGETNAVVYIVKVYGIAFLVGLVGMLLVYASSLTGAAAFQIAPGVVDAMSLLVIYPILAFLLGKHYWGRWLGVGIAVCLPALLFIGGFLLFSPTSPLRHRDQLHWPTLAVDNDSLLVIVLPATLLLSLATSYFGSRNRKASESTQAPVLPAGG